MADVNKPEKVKGGFEESIDLSAGFVPKTTPTVPTVESSSVGLTVDSFMTRQGPAATELEKFDFQPETPVVPDDNEAKPIAGEPEITWRWAAEADMPALQLLLFQAEITVGKPLYLRDSMAGFAAMKCRRSKLSEYPDSLRCSRNPAILCLA